MLTLYGHPMSRAHRVLWLLREIAVPFKHVPTDFLHGGNKIRVLQAQSERQGARPDR